MIYVMGAGRSGSTILGVTLGNCEDVFYAGELEAWLRRSGVPNFSGEERARFWNTVREEVDGEDLYGDTAWRYLEYSLAPLRIRGWLTRRRLRARYREIAGSLYRTIAFRAGATHVVDTSHYPLRARELQRLDGIDLYLIYLVRRPQDVAASFSRRDVTNQSKSLLGTNVYLFLTHLLSTYVFLRHRIDKRTIVRYEDFVAQPETTVSRILDWVDLAVSPPSPQSLSTGIPFQGNRLLDLDRISLRARAPSAGAGHLGAFVSRLIQIPWTLLIARLHRGQR